MKKERSLGCLCFVPSAAAAPRTSALLLLHPATVVREIGDRLRAGLERARPEERRREDSIDAALFGCGLRERAF